MPRYKSNAPRIGRDHEVVARVSELKATIAQAQSKVEAMVFEAALAGVAEPERVAAVAAFVAQAVRDRQYRLTVVTVNRPAMHCVGIVRVGEFCEGVLQN